MSRMGKSGTQGGMDGLIAAVRQLDQAKRQARALGIFADGRELLECPSCGLLEDVTSEGLMGGRSWGLVPKILSADCSVTQ
jgi:hypothetical protein